MSGLLSFFNPKPSTDTTLSKYKQDLDEYAKIMSTIQQKFTMYSRAVRILSESHADIAESVRAFNGTSRPNHPSTTAFYSLQIAFRDQIRKRWEVQFSDDVMVMFEHWTRQADAQRNVIANYEIARGHGHALKEEVRERLEARQKYMEKGKQPPEALEQEIASAEHQFKKHSHALDSMRHSIVSNQNRLAGPERFRLFDKLFVSMVQMQVAFEEELHNMSKKYVPLIKQMRNMQAEAVQASTLASPTNMSLEDHDEDSTSINPSSYSNSQFSQQASTPVMQGTHPSSLPRSTNISSTGLPMPDQSLFSDGNQVDEIQLEMSDSTGNTVEAFPGARTIAQDIAMFLAATQQETCDIPASAREAFGLAGSEKKSDDKIALDARAILECFMTPTKRVDNPEANVDPLGIGTISKSPESLRRSSTSSISAQTPPRSTDISQKDSELMNTPPLARNSSVFAPGSATKRQSRLSFGVTSLLTGNTEHAESGPTSPAGFRALGSFTSPLQSPRISMVNDPLAKKPESVSEEPEPESESIQLSKVEENETTNLANYMLTLFEDEMPSCVDDGTSAVRNDLLNTFNAIADGEDESGQEPAKESPESESDENFLRRTAKWLRSSIHGPLIDASRSSKLLRLRMKSKELSIWSRATRGQSSEASIAPVRQLLSTLQLALWPRNGLKHFSLLLLEDMQGVMSHMKMAFATISPMADLALDEKYTSSPDLPAGSYTEQDLYRALIAVTVLQTLRQSLQHLLEEESARATPEISTETIAKETRSRASSTATRARSISSAERMLLPALPPATTVFDFDDDEE